MWVAKLCHVTSEMLSSRDRARRWRLLANIERTTERLRRNRESMRRSRTSRQLHLSTHDQIESSSSSRNHQRRKIIGKKRRKITQK